MSIASLSFLVIAKYAILVISMEEQAVNNQVQQSPVTPVAPKPNYRLVAIIVLAIIFVILSGLFIYEKYFDKSYLLPEVSQSSPTPTPDLYRESTSSAATANWKTYDVSKAIESGSVQNPLDYHFSIKYPPNWQVKGILVFRSPDYQAPTTGAVEEVLSGARINIMVIQKEKKFSEIQQWFNSYFVDHRTSNVIYKPRQIAINAGNAGQVQGLEYDNVGYENVPGVEGKVLAKLFAVGNIVYEFKIVSKEDPTKYVSILDQILSTFKFLDFTFISDSDGWLKYTNTTHNFEIKLPSGTELQTYDYSLRFWNYDKPKHLLDPGEFITEISLANEPCRDRIEKNKTKNRQGEAIFYRGSGYRYGDAAGIPYMLCAQKGEKYIFVAVYENNQNGNLANKILSTFKFLDQNPSATCIPRPACLDAVPRCLIPESENMCPPSPKPTSNQVVCTQDAKQCPDGSYVSRQPPTCEFAKCP